MLRPKLNRVWTSLNANMRRDPGDAKYNQGWVAEIPTFQVLNYLQYKCDMTLLALAERGISEWGTDVQYGSGSVVWDNLTRKIYVATVGSPSRPLAPSNNPTQWTESSVQVSRASYDAVVAAINAHIADVTGNPHQLTAARLNAYNKSETDAIIAQYNALVRAHADDHDNPHEVTATQVGAVPVTGGTYSGDVIFEQGIWFDASKTTGLVKEDGFYLVSGSAKIGIDSTGAGVVGTTGNMSRIVTEATYAGLKAAQEPSYAAPPPVFKWNLIGGLNINDGVGIIESSQPVAFDAAYGSALSIVPGVSSNGIAGNRALLNITNPYTFAFDILSTSPRQPSGINHVIAIGLQDSYVIVDNASRLIFTIRGLAELCRYQLVGQLGLWYRVVATYTGTVARIYVNGVKVVESNVTVDQTGLLSSAQLWYSAATAEPSRTFKVRNHRVWDTALTERQVSTL